MVQPEVTELVREHGLQLRDRQGIDERVEEHDPFRPAEAREVGVAVGASFRAVHDEDSARLEAAAARKHFDRLAQAARLELAKPIEERERSAVARPSRGGSRMPPTRPTPRSTMTRLRAASARATARRAAAGGSAPIARPFSVSTAKSAGVVRLKPKRDSIRNVRQASNGNPAIAVTSIVTATVATCRGRPASPLPEIHASIAAMPPASVSTSSNAAPATRSTIARRAWAIV